MPKQKSGDHTQGKLAGAAVKGKGKGKQSKVAPPHKLTIQEVRSDSESEEEMAYIASAMKASVKHFGYRAVAAVHAQNCNNTQEESWSKPQPTLGASVRTSAFASMCLADDDLVRDQHSCGDPVSSSQETMTSNPLSLFSRLFAMSAQQAETGYKDAIILALRNNKDVKLAEARKDNSPLAPFSGPPYTVREVSDNEIQPESTPQGLPMTQHESRLSSYSWPTVF